MKPSFLLKLLFISFIFLFFSKSEIYCQKNFKFGKVSKEELEMKSYANDSSANAVVLGEEAYTYFHFTDDFSLNTEIAERIKILKQEGVELATVNVQYYVYESVKERVSGIEAWSYNLENGKIEKTKLDKKFIFEEKVNDNIYQIKFAIPNVKAGSVIEYRYKKTSPFYNRLPEWYFQRTTAPVVYSRYEVVIPEYFVYNTNTKGYEHIKVEEKEINEAFSIAQRGKTERVPHTSRVVVMTAENLPAMKDDDYIWSVTDYLSSVSFELAATKFPGSFYKSYSMTWEDIDKTLQSHTDFVRNFTKKTSLNDEVQQFDNISDESDKIAAIYNYVKGKVRWNGEYAFFDNTSDALKNGVGNNVQINGLIISALNSAGIKSYPVLLRRRSQGRLPLTVPSLDKLTTFIVAAETKDGTVYYLDGSATRGGLNMLPSDLLVDKARTFDLKENGKWVDLTKLTQNQIVISNSARLNPDGSLECEIDAFYRNLPAYDLKNHLYSLKDSTEYIEKFENDNDVEVIRYSAEGHDDNLSTSVKSTMFIKKDDLSRGNFIYINPLIIPHITKNSFTQSERKLPVEFKYPMVFQIISTIEIPEDYVIEELPKSARIALDQGAGAFNYAITGNGNKIQLNYKFNLNEIIFSSTSYGMLKQFWEHLTTKNSEMVVLKKK